MEDPGFAEHDGVDFSTPGAGLTTITQSAAKRLAFETFRPGIGKIRQTGYAMGLESRLSKDQILALWLDTLEMGRAGRLDDGLLQSEFCDLWAVALGTERRGIYAAGGRSHRAGIVQACRKRCWPQ